MDLDPLDEMLLVVLSALAVIIWLMLFAFLLAGD